MIYDILQYGAVGDGTTNDGPAIQKAIDACATIDEVNATKDKAIADMMAVPTAEQLQAHKTEVLNEFEAYFASLSKSDYSEEDWAKIESQYAYYKNALNAAQTTADMDRALAAFLNLSNPTNLNCLVKAKRCAAFMGMPKNTRFFQLAQRLKNWAYPSIASLLP